MRPFFVVIAGFVIAPIVPAVAIALFSPAFNGEFGAVAGASVFFYFFALLPTIVLGVPAFLVLLRFNLVRWWSSAVGGAAIGLVVAFAAGVDVSVAGLGFYSAIGALGALAFWVVVRHVAIYHHGQVPAA